MEISEEENLLLKHILIQDQKVKHCIQGDEKIAIYSKKEEKLLYKGKFCGFTEFGKIHCDEIKKKESVMITQFYIEINKIFVPVSDILKSNY